ncbi:MAG: hypothetical protein LC631_07570 [Desulfovibrionales bacterium]|nr:hypothetical protein [Desulfovibrionales bacterium]
MEKTPEKTIRSVVDQCADCEQCRDTMTDVCPFFPRLYEIFDRERDGSFLADSKDLRGLVELCNLCGLCPCPDIRARVLKAKSDFVRRDGMPLRIRLIQDVEKVSRYLSSFHGLGNLLVRSRLGSGVVKELAGVHRDRMLPEASVHDFPSWAEKTGLCQKHPDDHSGKARVALFSGCTFRYFFPEVARAAVGFLQKNQVEVYYPPQKCCSMPPMLEGDSAFAGELAGYNLEQMNDCIKSGYDIVCSCPTCGYMFKKLLGEKACYSPEYQESVGGDETYMLVPVEDSASKPEQIKHRRVHRSMYSGILKDDGVFSHLNPLKRIEVAEKTFDLGQYLLGLFRSGKLDAGFSRLNKKVAYYPPCHTREQNMGLPYADLLKQVPGLEVQVIEGSYLCCGMAGIMGCKKEFHHKSLEMGRPLMEKIKAMRPDILVTECLSCRLQFRQALPFVQAHPIEILAGVYGD